MKHPDRILVTRKRWDTIFGILFLASLVVAAVCILLTGHFRYSILPAALCGMWMRFRNTIPLNGRVVQTVEGNAQTLILLCWLMCGIIVVGAFTVFDICILEHHFNEPLKGYHWLFLACFICTLTLGANAVQNTRLARLFTDATRRTKR